MAKEISHEIDSGSRAGFRSFQPTELVHELYFKLPALQTIDWQSRAHIAQANAALAVGSLESADAALSRVPHDLPTPLLLDAELARANLYARENRKRDAFALFDAVEKSGDEGAAARAMYAHVEAGLQTKTMSADAAIDMLEKLR